MGNMNPFLHIYIHSLKVVQDLITPQSLETSISKCFLDVFGCPCMRLSQHILSSPYLSEYQAFASVILISGHTVHTTFLPLIVPANHPKHHPFTQSPHSASLQILLKSTKSFQNLPFFIYLIFDCPLPSLVLSAENTDMKQVGQSRY